MLKYQQPSRYQQGITSKSLRVNKNVNTQQNPINPVSFTNIDNMTNSDLVFSDIVTKSSLNSDSGFNDESKVLNSETTLQNKEPTIKSPRDIEYISPEKEISSVSPVKNSQAGKNQGPAVIKFQRKPMVKRPVIITDSKLKKLNKKSIKFTSNDNIFKEYLNDEVKKRNDEKNDMEVEAEVSDRGISK